MARAFSLLFVPIAAAVVLTSPSCKSDESWAHREDRLRRTKLDVCLGDERAPLTPEHLAQVRSAWEQIARGVPLENITPLPLRTYSQGVCTESWWAPMTPSTGCNGDTTFRFIPFTMRAGPVVYDVEKGTWSTRDAGDELWIVDDHIVLRRWPANDPRRETFGDIDLETSTGERRKLKGFPERILDDDRAVVRADPSQHLVDTRTGRVLLDVKPKGIKPRSVAGVVAAGAKGNELLGALDFGETTWTAFVMDVRGRHIAHVDADVSNVALPQVNPERDAIALVAWRPPELEAILVRGGNVVMHRTEKLEGVALSTRDAVVAATSGDTIAAGLGATLVVLHGDSPRVVLDTLNRRDTVRSVAPLAVLKGGHVVIAQADGGAKNGVIVLDARNGEELARIDDAEGARIFDAGARAVLLDSRATEGNYVVLVDGAKGALTRGTIGETKVGRFTLRTFAGIPDPVRVCGARLFDKLPPLVVYGDDAVLPAALVK